MSESLRPGQHFGAYFIGLVPMAFFSFPLYQVARLFPFVSSLDLREGQAQPSRGPRFRDSAVILDRSRAKREMGGRGDEGRTVSHWP